jgi:isopentenyl-diphosphate delta-isomerase
MVNDLSTHHDAHDGTMDGPEPVDEGAPMFDDNLSDLLILVDENDRQIGAAPKLRAHQEALLHRAFSVFLFDRDGRMLLTRRAPGKYHSGGLWTNACCSHPRDGETLAEAVPRRLAEELGVSDCPCREVGSFVYRADFANGLTEHELDHVFVGEWSQGVTPDPLETSEIAWWPVEEIQRQLNDHPERFTAWFAPAFALATQV